MAKVSLRIYNREIGTLIDQGQIEEAVGHCHHILKSFPKHLETYRLLGKAYLEAKRYKDAADIFSRLIMSVPDDFVAHVGMSLIADENEKLDEAMWHMERAFESQPSNAAVQSELQRLYGRRDGVQPPKVRMTSGALANVYVQGELYTQAIAEIMNVEAQDPGRMDMQILLAKAYYYSGQRVEASKIASDLLAKYPYCLDANRILIEILPETSRAESTQVYRHRVNALDPYATFAQGSVFRSSEVADAAVNLERLDWHPGSTPQLDSDWDTSAGIQLDQEGEQPAWLQENENAPQFGSAPAMETPAEEKIPDFMREAGWGASSGTAEEENSIFDKAETDEPIAQGEMPDWMKDIAPKEEELTVEPEENMGDAMADDWINDLLGDSEGEEKPQEKKPEPENADTGIGSLGTSSEEQDAALNWLESLATNQGANPEELITDPNARTEDAPEWVQKAQDASIGATATNNDAATEIADSAPIAKEDDDDMPKWLQDDEDERQVASEIEEPPLTAETQSPAEAAPISDPTIGELGTSSDDQDAALNWLESLATNQGANPDELITDPNARTEDAPEWVQKAQDVSENIEETPPPMSSAPPAMESDDDDDMGWLNALSEDAVLTSSDEGDKEEALAEQAKAKLDHEAPVPMPSTSVEEPEMPDFSQFENQPDTPVVETPVEAPSEMPAEFTAEVEEDDTPTWIKRMDSGEEAPVPEQDEPKQEMEDDLPTWLSSLDTKTESEQETAPKEDEEDLPDWLKADEETTPEPAEITPVQADEWKPVEPVAEEEKNTEETLMPAQPEATIEETSAKPKAEEPSPVETVKTPRKKTPRLNTTMLRDVILLSAQAAMREGNIPAALTEYEKMIKKNRLLDETIYDLREALYDHPIDVSVWQTLGDAYMRAGRLQDALDAYTKAQELLR
ncbi:MAG: tetratricopeptide repeat protein [Anaerolineae bacterium]|jgi:tetratricopeptide (TPR) repeat protein|nr:tetratricopeptide repeat protein [Anaerolineae bacterium]MBT7072208.1 tetratricopeptide repeat protein [Anaerolineae bacterium]MBT7323956.1 tetratricopeptide repeat protein [Anaerolineae bacterium]